MCSGRDADTRWSQPVRAAVPGARAPSMRYSNLQVVLPVTTLGEPSSSRLNALLLQNRPPEIVLVATAIGPRLPVRCTAPLIAPRSSAMEGAGGGKAPGPVLLILTPPLMTSPSQSISSAPKISWAAPSETTPPLIVEPHAISIPPALT